MLDRQNKKISEMEDTIKKLESLKNLAESQNAELNKKLKENATKIKPAKSFRAAKQDSPKDSPNGWMFFISDILLDRQNKKISEMEDTIKKLESLKNLAESQNAELNKKASSFFRVKVRVDRIRIGQVCCRE
eukprot:sb/3474971/